MFAVIATSLSLLISGNSIVETIIKKHIKNLHSFIYDLLLGYYKLISLNVLTAGKNPPDEVNVVIEIPKGSNIKYEIDIKTGAIFVDRWLSPAMSYPFNYGFIPNTTEDNGDPVDVFVLTNDPLEIKSVICSRPVGVLLSEDQDGQDPKIIAVPITLHSNFSGVMDLKNIPDYMLNRLKHFIEHHKDLEKGKYVRVKGWEGKEDAKTKVSEAIEKYNKK